VSSHRIEFVFRLRRVPGVSVWVADPPEWTQGGSLELTRQGRTLCRVTITGFEPHSLTEHPDLYGVFVDGPCVGDVAVGDELVAPD
jgi:hypothetical protein